MFDLSNVQHDWTQTIDSVARSASFRDLVDFVENERLTAVVYPGRSDVFRSLAETSLSSIKAVIVGQDPYHDVGQANGLAFSVSKSVPIPPTLRNILKELSTDTGEPQPDSGDLTVWARRGVLLLNTVLTVRAHLPGSHRKKGWEQFTGEIIKQVSDHQNHCAFVLWGSHAARLRSLIDEQKHKVVSSPHPSPLSAHRGFLGSKPFTQVNRFLIANDIMPIDWRLTND